MWRACAERIYIHFNQTETIGISVYVVNTLIRKLDTIPLDLIKNVIRSEHCHIWKFLVQMMHSDVGHFVFLYLFSPYSQILDSFDSVMNVSISTLTP